MLNPEDAAKAVEYGADGIDVSNHGGRNLDGIISPIEVLPQIVDAEGKRATVFVGSDVVKAIALGVDAVMVGRSALYGAAAGGFDGAVRALDIYRDEISRVMAPLGCNRLAELGPHYSKIIDPTLSRAVVDGLNDAAGARGGRHKGRR